MYVCACTCVSVCAMNCVSFAFVKFLLFCFIYGYYLLCVAFNLKSDSGGNGRSSDRSSLWLYERYIFTMWYVNSMKWLVHTAQLTHLQVVLPTLYGLYHLSWLLITVAVAIPFILFLSFLFERFIFRSMFLSSKIVFFFRIKSTHESDQLIENYSVRRNQWISIKRDGNKQKRKEL